MFIKQIDKLKDVNFQILSKNEKDIPVKIKLLALKEIQKGKNAFNS